ncbi:MAG: RlmE family RNA methyltransferase, partial [Caulobacteraceae bacterium]
ELDRRFGLISRGSRVVDLGSAPGGWLQVALKRGAGKLVGIDRTAVEPVGDALILQGDFIAEGAAEQVLAALDGGADLVLSDLAPNTTGHRATDHLRIMALAEAAVDFAELALVPGGAFVCKAFEGAGTSELVRRLQGRFSRVRRVKPKASLAESSEIFLVALGFRGD